MEARKAVAERLGWTIEGRYICRRFDDGTTDNSIATIAEDVAFNLCVSLQERVDVLEKALREWESFIEFYVARELNMPASHQDMRRELKEQLLRFRAALSPKEGGVK